MSRLSTVTAALITAVGGLVLVASPAQAGGSGRTPTYTETVTGYLQQTCEEAGGARMRELQAHGYVVTFVGCGWTGTPGGPWRGTIRYR